MNWVFTSLLLLSVGQTVVCGLSATLIISYVGRLLFLLRWVGSVVPYKVSIGFEIAHLFFIFLGIIFTKAGVNWVSVLLSVLFCSIACLLYVIDDRFYLYVVTDDDTERKDEGDA